MAIIKRAPLKNDPPGTCSRWRVIIYNPATAKHEWHTVKGTETAAERVKRELESRVDKGNYVSTSARMKLEEVAKAFLAECKARNRRTSTILNYESVLNTHLLEKLGKQYVHKLQKKQVRLWLTQKLEAGTSVAVINRIIKTLKTLLFYAKTELDAVDQNIMERFRPFEGGPDSPGRRVNRGAFSEEEVRSILAAAATADALQAEAAKAATKRAEIRRAAAREGEPVKPVRQPSLIGNRALIGLLCFTGMRPGECYALRWQDVDLVAGKATISRNWDWRGKRFTQPKTRAGARTVALSGWIVEELKVHQARTGHAGEALLFATRTGQPMNPSNVRRDVWLKVVKRAQVRRLDMYSLRHTFASLGRVSGEEAFNVARAMGHARSTLVDQVYAHSLQSGMASVAERVTARALGEQPKLRVIEGGQRSSTDEPLENAQEQAPERSSSVATG